MSSSLQNWCRQSRDPGPVHPDAIGVGLRSALFITIGIVVVFIGQGLGPAGLVFPGSQGAGGALMVEDFGSDAVPERYNYDGQPAYVIARWFPDIDQAQQDGAADFRINRVLQSALASVGGEGNSVVILMSLWGVIGVGLASGALADLAGRHGRDPRVGYGAAIAMAFPAVIATSEPLAFGLGFLGLAFFDRNRLVGAATMFALAGLGRETALVFALAAALVLACDRQWIRSTTLFIVSAAPFLAWSTYVRSVVPSSSDPTTDFLGFLNLPQLGPVDYVVSGLAAVLMVVALIGWRDVPALFITAAFFLAACLFYIGDQYRFHGLIRVSSAAVALGVAVVLEQIFRWRSPAAAAISRDGNEIHATGMSDE